MTASLNPYISQFGEEFDAGKSSQYRMTIQFSLGGLSYALLDTESRTLVAVECFQSDLLTESNDLWRALERALESKGLNSSTFQQVICIADERTSSLIPEPLFDPADKEKYLDFTFHQADGRTIMAEKIETIGCYNVFSYPKALQDRMLGKWKNAITTHSSSVFALSTMQNETITGVFVNVRNRDFDMLIKKEGKLFFFNNFRFNTRDDFAYFLLFAMEQNGLSGHDTPVCFSGLLRPASEIIDLCGRYIKDIHFVTDPHELKISKALDEIPFQYYFIHYQALK